MVSKARIPLAVAAAALALLAATAARTVTFGDSGELISASWRFGIAHPPGYPLYTLVAGAILHLVPLGEPAFRSNLLSAVCAAAACGWLARWAYLSWGAAAGIAAGGIFATCGIVWSSATETEVYALHALLVVAFLDACDGVGRMNDDAKRRRAVLTAAAILGLGLAHHPTIVLALPAAAVLTLPAWTRPTFRGARTAAIGAAIAVAIPALLYATLLVRARSDPGAWGGVDSISRLVAHAGATRYRLYDLGWGALGSGAGWDRIATALGGSLAWTGLFAAAAGLLLPPLLNQADTRLRLALVVLAGAGVVFSLRYATEDAGPYLLPSVVAVAMLAGRGMAAIKSTRIAAIVALALTAYPAIESYRANDRSADRAAHLYAADMLASIPEHGILFADGDDTFLLAYELQVIGARPDVTIVDRRENLFGSVAFYGGVVGDEAKMSREIAAIGKEISSLSPRPIRFMGWPGYELPPAYRFDPAGLFFAVVPAESPPTDSKILWSIYHEREVMEGARSFPGAFADSAAATYPLMRGEEALARGELDAASQEFGEAALRAPTNETVLNTIGTIWARRGDLARAITFFEKAVAAKPQSVRAWLNLAQARAMTGDAAGAETAQRRARELVSKEGS